LSELHVRIRGIVAGFVRATLFLENAVRALMRKSLKSKKHLIIASMEKEGALKEEGE